MSRLPRRAASVLLLFSPALLAAPARAQGVLSVPAVTKTAGTGSSAYNYDFGPATSVNLNGPTYVVTDAVGNQYISDTANNCVMRIDLAGNLSTIAGLAQNNGGDTCNASLNNHPSAAQGLLSPKGLALDAAGVLYIADSGHNCVRALSPGKVGTANLVPVVDTCTGSSTASVSPSPTGVAFSPAGDLYVAVADAADGISQIVRHPLGASATTACLVAGNPSAANGTLCPDITTTVVLSNPGGVVFAPNGNMDVADTGNSCVREMEAHGVFVTRLGVCASDGSGSNAAALVAPVGVAFDQPGYLYISDSSNGTVQRLAADGTVVTLAGIPSQAGTPYQPSQDGQPAVSVPLNAPMGVSADPSRNIYVADSGNHILRMLSYGNHFTPTTVNAASIPQVQYYEINAAMNLSTAIGGGDFSAVVNTCNGPQSAGTPAAPTICQVSVVFKPAQPGFRTGPLVFSDSLSAGSFSFGEYGEGLGSELLFTPGIVNQVLSGLNNPVGTWITPAGDLYIAEAGSGPASADVLLLKKGATAPVTLIAPGAGLNTPSAITVDAASNVYVADKTLNQVLRLDTSGHLTVLYTNLNAPDSLALDNFNNLYVGNSYTGVIREVLAGGMTRVVAGGGTISNPNNVLATEGSFGPIGGLAYNPVSQVLYFSDSGDHRVYSLDSTGFVHYYAGNGTTSSSGDGTALGTAVNDPEGLALDPAGDLYIADGAGNRVWLVYASQQQNQNMVAIVGNGTAGDTGDGGLAPEATITGPTSLAVDATGNLWFNDPSDNLIRQVSYPPPVVNFGNVPVNTTSPAKTVTLWNAGTQNLNQTAPLVVQPSVFAVNGPTSFCGTTILAGATCNYGFTFTPVANGPYSGTGTVTDDSAVSPSIILFNGNGTSSSTTNPGFSAQSVVAIYSQPYTLSARVTGNGTTAPGGTVTFQTGATLLGTAPVAADGSAVLAPSPTALNVSASGYMVTVTYSGDANYSSQTATINLVIQPEPVTITPTSLSRPYNQPNPPLTGTITGVAPGQSIVATYSTTAVQNSPVGTYPITATYAAGPNTALTNYAVTVVAGTLTVTSDQTILGDFGITATPDYQESPGGKAAAVEVTLTSLQSFAGAIALTCSGLPADAACTFSPATVTLNADGTSTASLSIATTKADAKQNALLHPLLARDVGSLLAGAVLLPSQLLGGAACLLGLGRRRARGGSRHLRLLWLLPLGLALLGMAGCSCPHSYALYTVTITGTTTNPASGQPLTHSTTVQLAVTDGI